MKNLKTTLLIALASLCSYTNVNAQETARKNKGKITMAGSPGIISVGGGISSPSSDTKNKAFLGNATAINADIFIPLAANRKGWDGVVKGHKMVFGVNIGAGYGFGSNGTGPSAKLFSVTSQPGPVGEATANGLTFNGFSFGAGPQANFYFGKFMISPMVLGQYVSVTQKEANAVQTIDYNGQTYDLNLASLAETKTSGFAVTPKLRLQYMISQNFGFYTDASYTMGPKTETIVSHLVPNGTPDQEGNYEFQALQNGTMVKDEPIKTSLNSVGLHFGVVIGLGGQSNKASDGKKHFGNNENATRKGWNGKIYEELVAGLTSQNGNGAKKYYNDSKEDCSATSGIECTDDIAVSDDFDMDAFDKYIASEDTKRIKDIFLKNDMEKNLPGLMALPNAKEVIESLKKGELSLKKIPTKNKSYTYQLGTPEGIQAKTKTVKVVLQKKHGYIGHVTLLR